MFDSTENPNEVLDQIRAELLETSPEDLPVIRQYIREAKARRAREAAHDVSAIAWEFTVDFLRVLDDQPAMMLRAAIRAWKKSVKLHFVAMQLSLVAVLFRKS